MDQSIQTTNDWGRVALTNVHHTANLLLTAHSRLVDAAALLRNPLTNGGLLDMSSPPSCQLQILPQVSQKREGNDIALTTKCQSSVDPERFV